MENVDNTAGIVALEIHVKKTQFTTISLMECKVIRTVDCEDLEDVAAFRCVGSWIRSTRKHVYSPIALLQAHCPTLANMYTPHYVIKDKIRRCLYTWPVKNGLEINPAGGSYA